MEVRKFGGSSLRTPEPPDLQSLISGALGPIRTGDQQLRRLLLYPLSYEGAEKGVYRRGSAGSGLALFDERVDFVERDAERASVPLEHGLALLCDLSAALGRVEDPEPVDGEL